MLGARLLAVVVLASGIAAPPIATAGGTCQFADHLQVPFGNYVLVVERSRCTTDMGLTYHRESAQLTEGDPNKPGHVVLLRTEYESRRQVNPDQSSTLVDGVKVRSMQTSAGASYRSATTSSGFTTCYVAADAAGIFVTGPVLGTCPPEPLMLV